jgi:hypothetical protein
MPTAFDAALRRVFADRNIGSDAVYTPPGGGAPVPCRVVKRHGDRPVAFSEAQPVGRATFIDVLAEAVTPARRGAFTIGGIVYTIVGDPVSEDQDRAIWTCVVR